MAEQRQWVPARMMARAVLADPNLTVPQRPRFLTEGVVVMMPDGILVEGGAERQVFRGADATGLLPRLLPVLDGSRTLEELCAALPQVPAETVRSAVALLYTRGLLEDGAGYQGVDLTGIPPEVLAYFQRHVDVTRFHRSAAEAVQKLQNARISVVGSPGPAAWLAELLKQSGARTVKVTGGDLSALETGIDLVVAMTEGDDDVSLLSALDDHCAASQTVWLRTACTGAVIEVGPYFERGVTRCYRCFIQTRTNHPVEAVSLSACGAWASLAANEAVSLITKITEPVSAGAVLQFHWKDWSQARICPPRVPGCPVCCPLEEAGLHEPPLTFAYEESVAFAPHHMQNRKGYQVHYKLSNLALQKDEKRYPGARRITLPDIAATPAAGEWAPLTRAAAVGPTGRLDLPVLAGLLLRSNGVRRQGDGTTTKVQRFAPTGGNLGSVQVYVLARRVDGLSAGCYLYCPQEHMLACLTPAVNQQEIEQLARRALGPCSPDFAALLVTTAALLRVGEKYQSFAYRVVNLDAGVAVAQLEALTRSYGLVTVMAPRWDDEAISSWLGIDADTEPITGVIMLHDRGDADAAGTGQA